MPHRRSNVLTTLEQSSALKAWWQSYGGGVGDSCSGSSSISGVPGSSYSSNVACSGSVATAGVGGGCATCWQYVGMPICGGTGKVGATENATGAPLGMAR